MIRRFSPLAALLLLAACDDPTAEHIDDDSVADLDRLDEPEDNDEGPAGLAAPEPRAADEWHAQTLSLSPPTPAFNVLSSKSGFQVFTWKKGAGDVRLGALADKSCFLAGVNGTFASSSDLVEVEVIDGQWLLRGTGSVAAASAICVGTQFASLSGSAFASGKEAPFTFDWTSTKNRGCFLTRLAGKLDGTTTGTSTTGARVYKNGDGTRWIFNVEGNSGSPVSAKARCLAAKNGTSLSVSDEVTWSGGEAPLLLSSGVDQPCLLTQVTGTFASPGDWVGQWLSELGGTLRQNLGGNKFTVANGITVKARCLNVTGTPMPPFEAP